MLVAQAHPECARAREPTRRLRRFQLDEERRHIPPPLGRGDRDRIAHGPEIAPGVVRRRERAPRFRPTNCADELDAAIELAGGARGGVLAPLWHEAAIDDHQPARGKPRRREHPITWSGYIAAQGGAAGIDQRLGSRQERGREFHATELVIRGIEARPALASWQLDWGSGQALLEGVDQRLLPGLALKLPRPEPDKGHERGEREQRWDRKAGPDRKSTRLNSSHLGISYAVFCLKKKKKNKIKNTNIIKT